MILTLVSKRLINRPGHTLTMIIGMVVSLIFGIFTTINGITYVVLQKQLDRVTVNYIGWSDYENFRECTSRSK